MARRLLGFATSDARHLQIGALACLLAINFAFIDFGARPLASGLAIAACLLTQAAFALMMRTPLDLRSPLISGLSLSLLLRAGGEGAVSAAGRPSRGTETPFIALEPMPCRPAREPLGSPHDPRYRHTRL